MVVLVVFILVLLIEICILGILKLILEIGICKLKFFVFEFNVLSILI